MKLIILSDIHANLSALKSVLDDISTSKIHDYRFAFLGDTINYGMRPNEVLDSIRLLDHVEVMLAGNHEMALFGVEAERFSSRRGKEILEVTQRLITKANLDYIDRTFSKKHVVLDIGGLRCLFVHGALDDLYWGTIDPSKTQQEVYKRYDIVFSGHSHKPHYFEVFYEDDNPLMRNKKKTIFINPGSVGQPRNHDNRAQYVVVDIETMEIDFRKCSYDIAAEQALYDELKVDLFYKTRIGVGV